MDYSGNEWIRWIDDGVELAEMMVNASEDGGLFVLDGARMRSLNDLFSEYSAAFRFPAYFGRNWAAFRELLADLDWLQSFSFLTVVHDAGLLLADDRGEHDTFVRVLSGVSRGWSDPPGFRPISFRTVLVEPRLTAE